MQNLLAKTILHLLIWAVFLGFSKRTNAQNPILKKNESIVATYTKEQPKSKIPLAKLKNKKLNFLIIYNYDASWADTFNSGSFTKTGSEQFNQLIKKYKLTIVKLFEVDENREALVLEQENSPRKVISCAKKLSKIDDVLTVHIKDVP